MDESELRKRNEQAKQNQRRSEAKISEHEEFDNIGLTKRNAEYMYKFKHALATTKLDPEKQAEAIAASVHDLKEAQKKGITAKTLFGSVDEKVKITVHPPLKPKERNAKNYAIDAIYNILWFLVLFCFLYGGMFLLAPKSASQGGVMGITGILLASIFIGGCMPYMTSLFAPGIKHKYNGMIRALVMVLIFALWVFVLFGAQFIPRIINPITTPIFDLVVGALGVCGILFMRSKFNITSGLFGGTKRK